MEFTEKSKNFGILRIDRNDVPVISIDLGKNNSIIEDAIRRNVFFHIYYQEIDMGGFRYCLLGDKIAEENSLPESHFSFSFDVNYEIHTLLKKIFEKTKIWLIKISSATVTQIIVDRDTDQVKTIF